MSIKEISIVVIGEPSYIKCIIDSISYESENLTSQHDQNSDYRQHAQIDISSLQVVVGSLQVDDSHVIDFYGSNDEAIFDFIKSRPDNIYNGLIIALNADDSKMLEGAKDLLIRHDSYLKKHALVVAVSGNDYKMIKQAEEHIRQTLRDLDCVAPVFSIDPNNKHEVSLLVESLICSANPGIDKTHL